MGSDIKLKKVDLLRVLGRVQGAIERKASMPILAHALIRAEAGRLVASGTDLYLAITATCECEGDLPSVCISAKTAHDIVKNLPDGDVKLTVDATTMTIRAGRSKFRVPVMPADDFPPLPRATIDELHKMDAGTLSRLIALTGYSVSDDDTRPHLASLLLEGEGDITRAVSTDGHRLSLAELAGPALPSMMIPAKGVAEIKRLCDATGGDVQVGACKGCAFAVAGDVTLSVKLTDESFPPYRKVIPTEVQRTVLAPRDALTAAVRRVSLVASSNGHGVRLTLSQGALRVQSEDPGRGEGSEELDVDYAGLDEIVIGANARYLLDVLGALTDDEVKLELQGDLDPIVIRADGFVGVVMPMRI